MYIVPNSIEGKWFKMTFGNSLPLLIETKSSLNTKSTSAPSVPVGDSPFSTNPQKEDHSWGLGKLTATTLRIFFSENV